MQKFFTKLLYFFIALLPSCAMGQSMSISLEDVMSMIEQSSEYHKIKNDSAINKLNYDVFKALTLPQISISASPNYRESISLVSQNDGTYSYTNQRYSTYNTNLLVSQLLPFTGGTLSFMAGLSNHINHKSVNNHSSYYFNLGTIQYKQDLFGFNEYKYQKKIQKAQKDYNEIKTLQDIEKLKLTATSYFFGLMMAQKLQQQYKQSAELAQFILDKSRILYADRRISGTTLNDAEINLLQEENSSDLFVVEKYRVLLCQLLKLPASTQLELLFDDSTLSWSGINEELVISRAIEYNFSAPYKLQEIEAEMAIKDAGKDLLPQIQFELGLGQQSKFQEFSEMSDNYYPNKYISMTVSIPIFDGGSARKRKKIAKIEYENLKLDYNNDIEEFEAKCHLEFCEIPQLIKHIKNYKNIMVLQEQQMESIKVQAEEGRINTDQYMQQRLLQQKTIVNYYQSLTQLFNYIYKYRQLALYDIYSGNELMY